MLNRRQFLLGVGGGAMLAGLGPLSGCSEPKRATSLILNREENWANSICQLCPSACGLRVRLANGNPVTVAGNPLHPVNRGGLCARGAAGLQLYYDPDRFAGPLRRDQAVIGGWAPVEWNTAIAEVAARVNKSIAGGAGRVAVIRGDGQDISSALLGRLVRAADSSWVVDMKSPSERVTDEALRQMHGAGGRLVYDLANASFVLSLDSGLLEAPSGTMNLHRNFADMRAAGGRFVHAGPRLGVTGSKADAWLPIRPGTLGVLALGVAHMLIKEGYSRAEFLRDHTTGFYDWTDEAGVSHMGVRSWILREFSPQRVAEITGVGWDRIIRTAREFGVSARPLAVGPLDGNPSSSVFDMMAVHTLNTVAGAVDVPGGVLLARRAPFEPIDEPGGPNAAVNSPEEPMRSVEELAAWVLASKNPPIDVCFVHEADPVFQSPQGDKVAEALRKIPFVVSTSPVVTDTTENADLVLPASLWLERTCDSATVNGSAYPVVSFSAAAAKPRADSRNIADVVLTVAKRVGGRVAEHLPWAGYDEVADDVTKQLFESGVGDTFSAQHRSTWAQLLERSGWRTASYGSIRSLRKNMETSGGWWDPAYYHGEWRRLVPEGEHRINLAAAQFASKSYGTSQGTREGEEGLSLYLYSELALNTRTSASLPYLQDLGSPLAQRSWVTNAEMNSETGAHLEIRHGDSITIRNGETEIEAVVSLSPGIRPDIIAVHTGGGRVNGGRYAAGIGANPFRLVTADLNTLSRRLEWQPVVVQVERVV